MKKEPILINGFEHIPYIFDEEDDENRTLQKSEEFLKFIDKRRSIRTFSTKLVSKKTIENIILSASTSPSGAHKQPWTFCAISNSELKKYDIILTASSESSWVTYKFEQNKSKGMLLKKGEHLTFKINC